MKTERRLHKIGRRSRKVRKYNKCWVKLIQDLSAEEPDLAGSLVQDWIDAADFAEDAAESILLARHFRLPYTSGRVVEFLKYEVLGERGRRHLLRPYLLESLLYHAPLMDNLDESTLERLRVASDRVEAGWAKLLGAILCRFPTLAAKCGEAAEHRLALNNLVADLYLGERHAQIDVAWELAHAQLVSDLEEIRRTMEAVEGGKSL